MKAGLTTVVFVLFIVTALPAAAQAPQEPPPDQAWAEALAKAQKDIAEAQADLNQLHREIAAEREELTESIRQANAELEARRAAVNELDTSLATAKDRRDQAENDRQRALAELNASKEMLLNFRRDFPSVFTAPEAGAFEETAVRVDQLFAEQADANTLARALLEPAFTVLAESKNGRTLPGRAAKPSGEVIDGTYAVVGPLLYFADDAKTTAGIAVQHVNDELPTVISLGDEADAAVRDLVATGAAVVPLDPTRSRAVRMLEAEDSWREHVMKGGAVMVPILLLAAVCLVLAVLKWLRLPQFNMKKTENRLAEILAAVNRQKLPQAKELASTLRKPLGPVIEDALNHTRASKEHLEEIMYEQILAQIPSLERHLSVLAVCASAAPLLGLFGTVTGMIHTFKAITVFGTGDAQVLSSGISEALITTEFGLGVAIPALLVHAYLSRRVKRIIASTQQACIMFVNGLKLRVSQEASTASD